jgi:hypothetical protein
LATNENDVPVYVQTATDIDSWAGLPSDYERNSAGSSAKNFWDAIKHIRYKPQPYFQGDGFFPIQASEVI